MMSRFSAGYYAGLVTGFGLAVIQWLFDSNIWLTLAWLFGALILNIALRLLTEETAV
jgi:hypothetical protein